MHIIAISGKAQHGKDTAAQILKSQLENEGCKTLVFHYADLLKHICRSVFGWSGEKDSAGRALLQRVGTDVIRAQAPDFWVDFLIQILTFFPREWDFVIVPDCRFPNEIKKLRQDGFSVTHLRVVHPSFDSGLSPEQQAHPSETALDATEPDYCLLNDSTVESLAKKLSDLIFEIRGVRQLSLYDQSGWE